MVDVTGLERIAEAARGSTSRRSPLYKWLRENRHGFAELLDEVGQPDWQSLADEFTEMGFRSQAGEPLKKLTVRHTWWRVRRDVARTEAKKAGVQVRAEPLEKVPPSPAAASPAEDPADDEMARRAREAMARGLAQINNRGKRKV
jgi:hypothetical protein